MLPDQTVGWGGEEIGEVFQECDSADYVLRLTGNGVSVPEGMSSLRNRKILKFLH